MITTTKPNIKIIIDSQNSVELRQPEEVPSSEHSNMPEVSTHRTSRTSGKYLLNFKGRTIECRSLSGLLAESLKAIEAHKKGTLEKLSSIKPRTKRIVSRDRNALFDQRSAEETKTWLKRASELAGLHWGRDFSISL
jgi:hypothetical protein